MQPEIGLRPADRHGVTELLHTLLADEYVLYTKTRKAHWNVTGPLFTTYHSFFEEQYDQLAETIDEVAERSLMLGFTVPATLVEFSGRTRLSEQPGENPDAAGLIRGLLADHEAIIRFLRQDIVTVQDAHGDTGTADFLTGLMEQHEKMAWMLRALLS